MNLAPLGFLISALVYSLLGLAVFVVAFLLLDWITPYHLWQEIVEKQNRALGVLLGLVSLGIALIIAASIHGS